MNSVVILRGIAGSGKSTLAAKEYPGHVVCSADHFHTSPEGVYQFKPEKAPLAHQTCLRKFLELLEKGAERVLVDNTNTSAIEVAPYYALAAAFGYEIEIVTVRCDPEVAFSRNQHEVPKEVIQRMAVALESPAGRLPPYWTYEDRIVS